MRVTASMRVDDLVRGKYRFGIIFKRFVHEMIHNYASFHVPGSITIISDEQVLFRAICEAESFIGSYRRGSLYNRLVNLHSMLFAGI